MKLLPITLLAATLALVTTATAQDEQPVNAFDDLARKGVVKEADSPMRQRADAAQVAEFTAKYGSKGYICITEDRSQSIRMSDAIPEVWSSRDPQQGGSFSAAPGEFYTYQVGVFATATELDNLTINFSDLRPEAKGAKSIPSSDIRCFNSGGVGVDGRPFSKNIEIEKGTIQPLWVGVQIPLAANGVYHGTATIKAEGVAPTRLPITITVSGDPLPDGGVSQGWRLSRLQWLDSKVGSGSEPTAPYTPITINGNTLNYLGGEVTIGPDGLPATIETHYNPQVQLDPSIKVPIIASAMQFVIETTGGGIQILKPRNIKITQPSSGRAEWVATLSAPDFSATVNGFMEFDGFSQINIKVKALRDVEVKDIRLEVPYTAHASRYGVGMGRKGGDLRVDAPDFRWDTTLHQDAIWIGNLDGGLNIKFRDENYRRPLVNVYYALGRLNMPASWGNDGRGGVSIKPTLKFQSTLIAANPHSSTSLRPVTLTAFSGEREMDKGDELTYGIEMLITPVKPLDMASHVRDRFYHSNSDVSDNYIPAAKAAGANQINIHHKKEFYPYINYPYFDDAVEDFKAFSARARAEDIGTRVYYTTRELTVKVPELWALRSLGSEVIHDGPGRDARTLIHPNGPNEWLNENLSTHFIPAWYNAFSGGKYKGEMDISVITTPDSRWNNYYLEGLEWMIRNFDIRGAYIDDSALDRETLKRARRLLDADGVERTIDIHTWNHFNQWAGFANSLQMYADLLPYVDRSWIGEGFEASNTTDFWLVEMSGLPFGLLGETLDAHNIWRGMVYCMPPRLGWSGNPVPIWKLWDQIGMQDAVMYGYWNESTPVRSSSPEVLATLYKIGDNKALIAVANWNDKEAVQTQLTIDSNLLGFTPSRIYLPQMDKVQQGRDIDLSQPQSIEKAGGMFIMLEK